MNIGKRKELIRRELALYKAEELLKVQQEVEHYRKGRNEEILAMGKACHAELAEYEHYYHSSKEEKGIEIAKLEAKSKSLKQVLDSKKNADQKTQDLIESQNGEIERLNNIIELIIKEQPEKNIIIQRVK